MSTSLASTPIMSSLCQTRAGLCHSRSAWGCLLSLSCWEFGRPFARRRCELDSADVGHCLSVAGGSGGDGFVSPGFLPLLYEHYILRPPPVQPKPAFRLRANPAFQNVVNLLCDGGDGGAAITGDRQRQWLFGNYAEAGGANSFHMATDHRAAVAQREGGERWGG